MIRASSAGSQDPAFARACQALEYQRSEGLGNEVSPNVRKS